MDSTADGRTPNGAVLDRYAHHRKLAVRASYIGRSPVEFFMKMPLPELVAVWDELVAIMEESKPKRK